MQRRWCWISAVIALTLAGPASAQNQPDLAAKKAARTLADTGRQRYEAGDYQGALDALGDAEKYFHAPTITRMRAMAHEKLGHLVEARELHRQVAEEQLPPSAPPEFVTAKKASQDAVTALDARIPKILLTLTGAPSGTAVTIDGRALDAAAREQPIQVNPGKHTLIVEPPGASKITRELDLKERGVEKVAVELTTGAPTATASSSDTTAPAGKRSMLGPAIAFGAGGAGLLVGAIMGGLTFAKAGEIRKLCGDDLVCPERSRKEVDLEGAKGFGYASTIGFVVAGVGAATGVILMILPGGKKKEEPARAAVVFGPGSIGVKGAF